MFLVTITYKVPLEQVEPYFEPHIAFVRRYYAEGAFVLTAKKLPRTGGLIIANTEDRQQLEEILNEDPFREFDLADFDIQEIQLSQVSASLLGK